MTAAPERAGPSEAGHLAAHLGDLAGRVAVESIDRIWIFPTRRVAGVFSTVIVLSAFDPERHDRRRILTAHYTVRVDKRGRLSTQQNVLEHGAAPADRLSRLIDGVLRRIDEELLAAPPRAETIAGDAARWDALVAETAAPSPPVPAARPPLASADPAGEE
ncbi:MAG TPA: hypothetical protein VF158_11170 [Longimicrobiales bacterium]